MCTWIHLKVEGGGGEEKKKVVFLEYRNAS